MGSRNGVLKSLRISINPLMPGVNKKVTHTETNLQPRQVIKHITNINTEKRIIASLSVIINNYPKMQHFFCFSLKLS